MAELSMCTESIKVNRHGIERNGWEEEHRRYARVKLHCRYNL